MVWCLDADLITDMGEHLVVAHINEYELTEVGVSGEVFQGVKLMPSTKIDMRDARRGSINIRRFPEA